jgi:hypothetical protein
MKRDGRIFNKDNQPRALAPARAAIWSTLSPPMRSSAASANCTSWKSWRDSHERVHTEEHHERHLTWRVDTRAGRVGLARQVSPSAVRSQPVRRRSACSSWLTSK